MKLKTSPSSGGSTSEVEKLKQDNEKLQTQINDINTILKQKDVEINALRQQIIFLEAENIETSSTSPGQSLVPFFAIPPNESVPDEIYPCLEPIFPDFEKDKIFEDIFQSSINIFENDKLSKDNWRKLYKDHSDVELISIYLYTLEIPSNKNYQIYTLLNSTITSISRSDTLPRWSYYLHHFFNGLKKLPLYELQQNENLYRGVGVDLLLLNPTKYAIGRKITFYAFSSTTMHEATSRKFAKNSGTLLIIQNCISGRSIAKISAHSTEAEVLFPPGATFLIKNIEKKGECREITLTQVPCIDKKLAELVGEKT